MTAQKEDMYHVTVEDIRSYDVGTLNEWREITFRFLDGPYKGKVAVIEEDKIAK